MDEVEWKRALYDEFKSFSQSLTEFFSLKISHCQSLNLEARFFDRMDMFIADLQNRFRNRPELRIKELFLSISMEELNNIKELQVVTPISSYGSHHLTEIFHNCWTRYEKKD